MGETTLRFNLIDPMKRIAIGSTPHSAYLAKITRSAVTRLAPFTALLLISACSTTHHEANFERVREVATSAPKGALIWVQSEQDQQKADQRVAELLQQTLTADAAVEIALLNNKGLQASWAEIGIAQADVIQAGKISNPGFTFGRTAQGPEREIERSIHFNLLQLFLMPQRQQMEQRALEQVQRAVAVEALALMSQTRKSFYQAVAAGQAKTYRGQVLLAAQAGSNLAQRMLQAGNFSKLQQAREQSFEADAMHNLALAKRQETATRERLARLMGLSGDPTALSLPERLPELPTAAIDQPDMERIAMTQRLDVQSAKLAAEQSARNLGLTQATRFVNVLEYGRISNSSNQAPGKTGWEISVELPLFDWGEARVAKAKSLYMQAFNRAAETAVNARSEVREAYSNYRDAYDIAKHQRDAIVPLKKRISEENLLRYNGMFIGVFELLADARSQINGVAGYLDTLLDFWVAQAELDMALVGKPTLTLPATQASTLVSCQD